MSERKNTVPVNQEKLVELLRSSINIGEAEHGIALVDEWTMRAALAIADLREEVERLRAALGKGVEVNE